MIEVYGKPNCVWCDQAKNLLSETRRTFNYYSVGTDISVDELKEKFPGVGSVPIIVVNGFRIGGFHDLKGYLEETSGGYAHDI